MSKRGQLEKPKDLKGAVKRIAARLRHERLRLSIVLVLSALGVVGQVASPKLLGEATNVIFRGVLDKFTGDLPAGMSTEQAADALRERGNNTLADMIEGADVVPGRGLETSLLAKILLVVIAVYVLSSLFRFIAGWIVRHIVQDLGWQLRADAQAKVDRLPLSYLDQHSRGDLLSRVTNDVDNITQALMQTIISLFQDVLTLIGITAMMFWISPKLALLSFIVLPPGFFLARFIMKKAQPHFRRQWDSTGKVSDTVEEAFTGHEVVTAFGLEEGFAEEFESRNDELRDSVFKATFISHLMEPAMSLVNNLGYVIVAVVGGLEVAAGRISLGSIQAFIQYSRQFAQPISQLASMANTLQSAAASAERIFNLLDAEEMEEDAQGELGEIKGAVTFDNVRFSYTPGTPVITGLSLHTEPGQTVAIVGPTGAGKTTLVNLLLRFYEVDSGTITIDGTDIATVSKDSLRAKMGMVLQDTWLRSGTIADNIAFGRSGATREDVVAAAKASSIDRMINQLPDGYETEVSDEGEGISVGEKQLLTIARAFLADPHILILDEATSSVDTRTEMMVAKAMERLQKGRTSFIIAHRLSTIRHADLIIVMEKGDVIEQGTHAELIEADGAYARLYRSQFADAATQ
ncbi:MAG: ABC transporter ATP-binding protein [Flaviflexus sp.]|nr:ABC transporter ATP-binding protein [Flaviflexus sp.]